jgi:hypothetical protein
MPAFANVLCFFYSDIRINANMQSSFDVSAAAQSDRRGAVMGFERAERAEN